MNTHEEEDRVLEIMEAMEAVSQLQYKSTVTDAEEWAEEDYQQRYREYKHERRS